MGILSSLKEERKLSFKHWRYQLLHWAFNVDTKNITHPAQTGLPLFLYSHYCPLFHLTNLIALVSPLILLSRAVSVLFWAFVNAVSQIDVSWAVNPVYAFLQQIRLPSPDVHVSVPVAPPPCKR